MKKTIIVSLLCMIIIFLSVSILPSQVFAKMASTGKHIDINKGENVTTGREVTLYLNYYVGIDQMIISNYSDFRDKDMKKDWEPVQIRKVWTLLPGDGVKHVYIMLKDGSKIIYIGYDEITLNKGVQNDTPNDGSGQNNTSTPEAGDMFVNNYSFEYGLNSWKTQWPQNSSISSEQRVTGKNSLKIIDTNATQNGTFVESDKISVVEGQTYVAIANTYIQSGSSAITVRFFDKDNKVVSQETGSVKAPFNKWTQVRVKAKVPINAKNVAVLVRSVRGTIYFDDIFITKEFTNLGPQLTSSNLVAGKFGKDAEGNNVLYTVLSGKPSKFVVMDITNEKVKEIIDLPYGAGAWGMTTSSDGKIYVGTYSKDSAPAHLYQYTPGENKIKDLGAAFFGDKYVWELTAGKNGEIYGGTYPSAAVFKYTPNKGITQIGSKPFEPDEFYVRSIAYDDKSNTIYAGISSHAHLIKYNMSTGERKDILPSDYRLEEAVYSLKISNGKLLAYTTPSSRLLVIDLAADKLDTVIRNLNWRSFTSQNLADDNKIYYISGYNLYYYDILSKTVHSTGKNVGMDAFEMEFIDFGSERMLVGLGANGRMFKYNLKTGDLKLTTLSLPDVPTLIHSIRKGNDGKIYSNGYMYGGVGIYSPLRSDLFKQYEVGGQSENLLAVGNKIYMGIYPGGYIDEYDTTIPGSGQNPKRLFTVGNDQDRPFGLASGADKLFVGTAPDYGKLGGALATYDFKTGKYNVVKNVVQNQSIVALAYKDGKVFGGTSVQGGLGIEPSENEAKLFVWDAAKGEKEFEIVPVQGKKSITSVIVGPDKNIWGVAEGYLFIFNPSTRQIVYNKEIVSNAPSLVWKGGALEIGKDGNVYGIAGGKLFKIDSSTKQVKFLYNSSVNLLTQDDFGNLYFTNLYNLIRYAY